MISGGRRGDFGAQLVCRGRRFHFAEQFAAHQEHRAAKGGQRTNRSNRAHRSPPPRSGDGRRPPWSWSADTFTVFTNNRAHRGRPVLGPRLEHPRNDRPQGRRQLGEVGDPLPGRKHRRRRVPHVELFAKADRRRGKNEAQAVDVRTQIDLVAVETDLFGRGEGIFAGESVADQGRIRRGHRFRNAEIDELGPVDATLGKQDVFRRYVAVDNIHLVRRGEPKGETIAQPQHLVRFEAPPPQDLFERLAVHELRDEIAQAVFVAKEPFVIDNRSVVDAAQFARFFAKQLHDLRIAGETRQHDLDRMLGPELDMPGAIDFAHPAAAQSGLDDIGMAEHGTRL